MEVLYELIPKDPESLGGFGWGYNGHGTSRADATVLADAVGYHPVTTTRLAAQARGVWSRYAPGDHLRSPSGWFPRRIGDS